MLEKTYVVVRRTQDGRSPLDVVQDVNSRFRPTATGSLAHDAAPIPGLQRWLDPVRVLDCGVAVLKMTPLEAEILAESFPEIELSEEAYLNLAESWDYAEEFSQSAPQDHHWIVGFDVTDVAGQPIEGAKVTARIPGLRGRIIERTDKKGRATLRITRNDAIFSVQPAHSYWDRHIGPLELRQLLRVVPVTLEALNVSPGFQWDLRASGMDEGYQPRPGRPVRIAIIDTGIAGHPDLPAAVKETNFISAEPGEDSEASRAHGTGLAGIIAGGQREEGVRGYAPHAELLSYRAVPTVGGASEIDLAAAITAAVDDGAEIICLAVATPQGTRAPLALREALRAAGQKGVVCVISAGNDSGPVAFPAAFNFPHCLSVGAYGRLDVIKPYTSHQRAIVEYPASKGFFLAGFSNRATGSGLIDVVAPGVACITTAPGGYIAASGTSIAAAHVAGMLAVVLEGEPDLRENRSLSNAEALLSRLRALAIPFNWGRDVEGGGRPYLLGASA